MIYQYICRFNNIMRAAGRHPTGDQSTMHNYPSFLVGGEESIAPGEDGKRRLLRAGTRSPEGLSGILYRVYMVYN